MNNTSDIQTQYLVQYHDDKNMKWETIGGRASFTILHEATNRAQDRANETGYKYRVIDDGGAVVFESGEQLKLF